MGERFFVAIPHLMLSNTIKTLKMGYRRKFLCLYTPLNASKYNETTKSGV